MLINPVYTNGKRTIVPLDAPSSFVANPGNAQITLTWTDPENETTSTGQTVATWQYTKVLRKTGSQPSNDHDGELVVLSSVKNQYQTTGYVDEVANGQTYYYAAFAYSVEGGVSEGAFVSAEPVAGTAVSTLSVGTLVKIKENGSPVEYMVVHQGLPSSMYDESCNGCWLVRKDIAENRVLDSANNDYANSDIQAYLNGAWTSRYETGILSQIKQVKIPYQNGTGSGGSVASGANGLSCKIFLLSAYELGWTTSDSSYFPRDGAKLSYFSSGTSSSANNKRIANYNGSAAHWWLRCPYTSSTSDVWSVYSNGNYYNWHYNRVCGVRPALVLPSSAVVDTDLNVIPA